MQKENVYHVYKKKSVVAHNLTYDELCEKVEKSDIDLDQVEIVQLSPPPYQDASY